MVDLNEFDKVEEVGATDDDDDDDDEEDESEESDLCLFTIDD